MENRKGISDTLRERAYATPALVPATPWLGSELPAAPAVSAVRTGSGIKLRLPAGKASHYAIWSRYGSEWRFAVSPEGRVDYQVLDDARLGEATSVFVSAVDRLGNESERVQVWTKAPALVAQQ
jgi:hypothetical protein